MRYPNIYSATELRHWHIEEEYEPGKCRSGGWLRRINLAWSVFTGRRDAIHWGNRSGEWKNDQQNYRDCTHPDFGKANTKISHAGRSGSTNTSSNE